MWFYISWVLVVLNLICVGVDMFMLANGHVGYIFNLLLNAGAAFWMWLVVKDQ